MQVSPVVRKVGFVPGDPTTCIHDWYPIDPDHNVWICKKCHIREKGTSS